MLSEILATSQNMMLHIRLETVVSYFSKWNSLKSFIVRSCGFIKISEVPVRKFTVLCWKNVSNST